MRQIVLPLALLLMTACNSSKEQPKPMEQATDTTTTMAEKVDTMQVDAITSATAIANPASFNGTLVIPPRNFATVSLSMDGIVKNLSLLPGTYIPKGAVLATLENPQFIELQQNYLDSHAQLEYLEAEYNRQTALSREEAASQKKYQQSKADYLSMKSRMQANAAQLRLLGIEPETLLKSGMVRLIAYEKDLNGMKVGSRVQFRVNGLGKQTFHATLISIGQQVDDTNRSIELYAKVLDGSPIFRPGMYVSARMEKE